MDEALLRAINEWAAHDWAALIATVFSSRWTIVVVCGPVGLFLLRQRRYGVVVAIALSMGAADAITARIMKPLVGRERPCRALDGLVPAARCGAGRSFPSGHAGVSFAFLVSAAPAVPYGWWFLTPIAAGVAGSRVVLGVHYPSDILAGAFFGSMMGGAGWWAWRRRETRTGRGPQKAHSSSGPPVSDQRTS